MSSVQNARDGTDAVRKFARDLGRDQHPARRILAKLGGEDGMTTLCAVEAVIRDLWPATTAKELVWLTRGGVNDGDRLELQAFDVNGELLRSAIFRLEHGDV